MDHQNRSNLKLDYSIFSTNVNVEVRQQLHNLNNLSIIKINLNLTITN